MAERVSFLPLRCLHARLAVVSSEMFAIAPSLCPLKKAVLSQSVPLHSSHRTPLRMHCSCIANLSGYCRGTANEGCLTSTLVATLPETSNLLPSLGSTGAYLLGVC